LVIFVEWNITYNLIITNGIISYRNVEIFLLFAFVYYAGHSTCRIARIVFVYVIRRTFGGLMSGGRGLWTISHPKSRDRTSTTTNHSWVVHVVSYGLWSLVVPRPSKRSTCDNARYLRIILRYLPVPCSVAILFYSSYSSITRIYLLQPTIDHIIIEN